MADLTTLQARLTEAETAYHRLLTGSQKESIGLGDMRVTYTQANADRLAAYISQLKSACAAAGDTTQGPRRRAITVTL